MMIATKHWLYIPFLLLLVSYSAKAQQCGNCKEIPKIAGFGFDIKVKQPNKEEERNWILATVIAYKPDVKL